MPRKKQPGAPAFGGDWTEQKLTRLRGYMEAYMRVMKNQRNRFTLVYLDAFAGAGHRYPNEEKHLEADGLQWGPPVTQGERRFFDGSARIAMELRPGFDYLVFVDDNARNIAELQKLKNGDDRIIIRKEDANSAIQMFCHKGNWHGRKPGKKSKGIVFLDPFGMQVTWDTIQAIAETGALDMWYLFPSGLGVNRMVARNRESVPESWDRRLDLCLGTGEWRDAWYKKQTDYTLFGEQEREVKVANIEAIEAFFLKRLQQVFPCVASKALSLPNSQGYKMFSLCFASAARPERGGNQALRIAEHLLNS